MNIQIALAEDNRFALQSILAKLKPYADLEVTIIATNGADLLKQLEVRPADLILMDIEMPVMDGIAATGLIRKRWPDISILMFTTFDDDDKIFDSILVGASGYLLKDESSEQLHKAITDTINGGAAMSAGIALKTLNYIRQANAPAEAQDMPVKSLLSRREIEILEQLKNGLSYQEIAGVLFISVGTVRKHIEHIYKKLQVNNKVNAIGIATRNKWV